MKKTLVAIAALTAVSAFAQSTVTIDGYMDRGYTKTDSNLAAKDAKGISSSAGTSTVRIGVIEDIGNGQKIGLSINTDFADAGGLTQDGAAAAAGAAANGGNVPTASSTFANSQSFLYAEDAKLGKVQLGNINNEMLTAITGIGGAFSTGVGSAYSSSWSVLNGYGSGATDKQNQVTAVTNNNETAGARGIRQAHTVKYVSPNIMGATVAIGQSLKNDVNGGTGSTVGVTDMSLTYENGPFKAMYASLKYNVGANDTAPTNGSLTAGTTNTHTATAVSYAVLPTLKLSAAMGNSKSSNGTIADSTFTQYGVTYTMGQFDIMAQQAKVDDKLAANIDRKMTGLGLNYNLSKTARAYVRYDHLNRDSAHALDATKSTDLKRTAIGISKSF